MTFDILQHLDQLKPDGGTNNPRGDHSFHCPECGAPITSTQQIYCNERAVPISPNN